MVASVTKKQKYNDQYINYRFTSILADGIKKPQCVLCFKVLGNNSMRPTERDPAFFKRHERSLGKQRLDESVAFQQQNLSVVEASYEVSIEIAKKKAVCFKDDQTEASECKIRQISLSDDTVKRRISEMSDDIMEQVIQEIKSSPTGYKARKEMCFTTWIVFAHFLTNSRIDKAKSVQEMLPRLRISQ
ncbi:ZBED8-like 5, partial [Homarus americanus]